MQVLAAPFFLPNKLPAAALINQSTNQSSNQMPCATGQGLFLCGLLGPVWRHVNINTINSIPCVLGTCLKTRKLKHNHFYTLCPGTPRYHFWGFEAVGGKLGQTLGQTCRGMWQVTDFCLKLRLPDRKGEGGGGGGYAKYAQYAKYVILEIPNI